MYVHSTVHESHSYEAEGHAVTLALEPMPAEEGRLMPNVQCYGTLRSASLYYAGSCLLAALYDESQEKGGTLFSGSAETSQKITADWSYTVD